MYPSDLTDSQWQNIKENFDVKILRRKRKYTIRQIINAILYVDKAGIQWRMLPNDFPDWRIVYYYFRTWAQDGTVISIHNSMAIKVRLTLCKEALLLDIQEFTLVSIFKNIV